MAKHTYKVECDNVITEKNRGSVRMVIETEPVKREPGKPPARTAKFICQLMFVDPAEAAKFQVGKKFTLTIEG